MTGHLPTVRRKIFDELKFNDIQLFSHKNTFSFSYKIDNILVKITFQSVTCKYNHSFLLFYDKGSLTIVYVPGERLANSALGFARSLTTKATIIL